MRDIIPNQDETKQGMSEMRQGQILESKGQEVDDYETYESTTARRREIATWIILASAFVIAAITIYAYLIK